MKLNRNFVQISTTALITSAAFIFYIKFFQAEHSGIAVALSEPISWSDAQKLMADYSRSEIMKTKYTASNGQVTVSVLKGFVFDAPDLSEIILSNHNGINPEKVLILFGQDGTFDDETGKQWPIMHLIAVGMRADGTILKDGIGGQVPSIYDKAEPCPPKCPL